MCSFGVSIKTRGLVDFQKAPRAWRSSPSLLFDGKGQFFGFYAKGSRSHQVKPKSLHAGGPSSGSSAQVHCRRAWPASILLARGSPDPCAHEGSPSLAPQFRRYAQVLEERF